MATTRLETLKSLVQQDPANAFTRYGLAMEYVNGGELESAMKEFAELLEHNPTYSAGYFHGGQTLEKLERSEEAKALYQRGIEVTIKTGDAHTRGELQGALDLLG